MLGHCSLALAWELGLVWKGFPWSGLRRFALLLILLHHSDVLQVNGMEDILKDAIKVYASS